MRRLVVALAMLLPIAAEAEDERLKVVTSFSVLADMTREIGGDRVDIRSLVGPDGDVHVYQPTPSDARALVGARLLVLNGLGLEGWIARLETAADFAGRVVTASDGVKTLVGSAGPDPHAWQDVANAAVYARNIAAGLEAQDPAHAAEYSANEVRYLATLSALDAWVRQSIGAVPPERRRIITTHDAFAYFGRAYGIQFTAPVGMTEDSDPSAAAVAGLIGQIRHEGIRALFIENMTDPRLIERLAAEAGATPGGTLFADALSKPGEGGETYEAMVRHNVTLMVRAMEQP